MKMEENGKENLKRIMLLPKGLTGILSGVCIFSKVLLSQVDAPSSGSLTPSASGFGF